MTEFYVVKEILRLEATSFITGTSGIFYSFLSNYKKLSPILGNPDSEIDGHFYLWNLEFWDLESVIQLKESGISLNIGVPIPCSPTRDPESIQYMESGIHSLDSRIQDCLEAKTEYFYIGLFARYKQILFSVFSEFYDKAKKYSFPRKN